MLLVLLPALALGACAVAPAAPTMLVGDKVAPVRATVLPSVASQGALVIGSTHPAATVRIDGRDVRVAPDGSFVFGIGRDASAEIVVSVRQPGTGVIQHRIAITPRDWPIERIAGVPPESVNPPPAIAARIAHEQALVAAARSRDEFARLLDLPVYTDNWLRPAVVDACLRARIELAPGECYGFKIPPALQGTYEVSNLVPTKLDAHYSWMSHLAKQDSIYWIEP